MDSTTIGMFIDVLYGFLSGIILCIAIYLFATRYEDKEEDEPESPWTRIRH